MNGFSHRNLHDVIIGECMGYRDVFVAVENTVREFLGDDFCSLKFAIIDPEDKEFYFLLKSGESQFNYFRNKYALSNDLIGFALKNFNAPQILANPLDFCKKKNLSSTTLPEAIAFVPTQIGGKTAGLLACECHSPGQEEENPLLRLLLSAAVSISLVLNKLHQHEIVRQELIEMRAVNEIGPHLYGAKKLDTVLGEIIDYVIEKLGFDRALICLIDETTHNLIGRVTRGYEDTLSKVNYPLATSGDVLAEVARSGKPQIIKGVRGDPRFPPFIRERPDIWQIAIVPLVSNEGRVWGTLSADHKTNCGQITPHRLEILGEFARHACIAIENARLYERVEHMAEIDGLTQVYNRQYFDRALKQEIPRVKRYHLPLSLLMLDVCDFKKFNDTYGHVIGDHILQAVARLLVDNVREPDIVARYGGDEFVVLMPNTTELQARMVQERIERATLLRNSHEDDPKERFMISMGLKSASAFTVDNILTDADRAMYRGREQRVKQNLLYALIANDTSEIERWDHFIASILKILGDKEPHFHNHSRRVMNYSVKIGQILGLDHYFLEIISIAALLHDIGKISINSRILLKTTSLTQDEYEIVKSHPTLGEDLLKGANYLKEVREIVCAHHERWDGVTSGRFPGYPAGKAAEDIPLGARILKVADAYDAMTSLRPYHLPMKTDAAVRELLDERGKGFDPQVIKAFVPYLRTITQSLSNTFPGEHSTHTGLPFET